MHFALDNDVETFGTIVDSIDIISFLHLFVLDPTTYIHQCSAILGNRYKIRLVFKELAERPAVFLVALRWWLGR
jgi:hypothetical protein